VTNLTEKVTQANKILRETRRRYGNSVAIAWTGGKDSTVVLHLVSNLFHDTPWQVLFNDSSLEFPEIYAHIKELSSSWKFELITEPHSNKDLQVLTSLTDNVSKQRAARQAKINSLKAALDKHHWQALVTGIRSDEHPSRSQETYFSARTTHMRVHPILDFTEHDIWEYTHRYQVPYVKLYDQGYRSLGEQPFTKKAKKGEPERSGREIEKELQMQKLRSLGYY